MAATNTIKLKRSNVQSNVPSLGDLTLGELAVNTFDGKVFIKKNDGSDSIETFVTTHAQITGSIELTSAVTSSFQLIQNIVSFPKIYIINLKSWTYVSKRNYFNSKL